MSRALHLTATGSVYIADHPLLKELLSEVLPTPESIVVSAFELVDDIARNTSTVSTKLKRDLIYRIPLQPRLHIYYLRGINSMFGSQGNDEGLKAFIEN